MPRRFLVKQIFMGVNVLEWHQVHHRPWNWLIAWFWGGAVWESVRYEASVWMKVWWKFFGALRRGELRWSSQLEIGRLFCPDQRSRQSSNSDPLWGITFCHHAPKCFTYIGQSALVTFIILTKLMSNTKPQVKIFKSEICILLFHSVHFHLSPTCWIRLRSWYSWISELSSGSPTWMQTKVQTASF